MTSSGHAVSTVTDARPETRDERAPVRVFASVEVHYLAAPVLAAWSELEGCAPCSIYQTRAWLLPWIDAFAEPARLDPIFVLARAADARPVALLPLGLRRRGPARIVTWLGGKDANFNMPLLAPPVAWTRSEVVRLLRTASRSIGRNAPDLFVLPNQPFAWGGVQNPLSLLPHQASASAAYGTALLRDPEAFLAAKLSKEARKKLRKKDARLAAFGPVTHVLAEGREAQAKVIDAFLELRNARFRAQNIPSPFEAPAMRAFIAAASGSLARGVELHALCVGERIVAVYGGAAHQGQWSGMFNAFDMDEAIAPSSPGDLLLTRIVAKACRDGMARVDLGIGAARYKAALCDEEIALFDAFVPMTPGGRLLAAAIAGGHALKRRVKADPRLFALANRLRALRPNPAGA